VKIKYGSVMADPINSDQTVAAHIFHHKTADESVEMFDSKVEGDFAYDWKWSDPIG
jgi:hypothetical protein